MRLAILLIAVSSYILVILFVWESERETRDEAHENRTRIVSLEETIVRMDAVGSAALHRHMETSANRAHPVTDMMTCPICPICK